MDTAGSPAFLAYPLVAWRLACDSTLVDVRGGQKVEVCLRPEDAPCDGAQQIRVGESVRFADEVPTLVAPTGKTIG